MHEKSYKSGSDCAQKFIRPRSFVVVIGRRGPRKVVLLTTTPKAAAAARAIFTSTGAEGTIDQEQLEIQSLKLRRIIDNLITKKLKFE